MPLWKEWQVQCVTPNSKKIVILTRLRTIPCPTYFVFKDVMQTRFFIRVAEECHPREISSQSVHELAIPRRENRFPTNEIPWPGSLCTWLRERESSTIGYFVQKNIDKQRFWMWYDGHAPLTLLSDISFILFIMSFIYTFFLRHIFRRA